MKKLAILITSCLLSMSIWAQTQTELNNKAKIDFVNADGELNSVYKKILQEYKTDSLFIKSVKEAQRQWIKFRDAQLKMKYPDSDNMGSILPMCRFSYLKELTQARTKELAVWVEGVEEGDVCSGSVKIKE